MQQTLILLKPDTIARGLAGQILARFESAMLRIEDCRMCRPSLSQLELHYADLKPRNERAFSRTTRSLVDKPFIAVVLSGPNAIAKARALIGSTDPLGAAAGTVRGDFGNDTIAQADAEDRTTHNLIHASDSAESARREIAIWFAAE